MKFRDRNDETIEMIETVCLILSLGAIFVQIWALMSGVESYLGRKWDLLSGGLVLSALCLACCGLMALTTFLLRRPKSPENSREKI